MSRRQTDPLRELTVEEQGELARLARATAEPAGLVARAKALVAVAGGASYTAAAHAAGRRSGDGVAKLVARFNAAGLAALAPRHGGGPAPTYTAIERERILAEARRAPDRARDGTAVWSLTTLQRAVRQASDGLPAVSTFTIWSVLREAGWSWQQDRTWCETGTALRKRQRGTVVVTDPHTEAKKS